MRAWDRLCAVAWYHGEGMREGPAEGAGHALGSGCGAGCAAFPYHAPPGVEQRACMLRQAKQSAGHRSRAQPAQVPPAQAPWPRAPMAQ